MKIAPSILDANFGQLQADINSIATADRIHLDVMDGHYVPGMTFGASIFRQVKFPIETEVHLMVENPSAFFASFIEMGTKGVTFHIETVSEENAVLYLQQLKQAGVRAGICIDGYTETEALTDDMLKLADQVLIMSVKAGQGGQSFMPESLEKSRILRTRGFRGEIEFDGGVKLDNVENIQQAGGDIVVVGSFLMKESPPERPAIVEKFQQI